MPTGRLCESHRAANCSVPPSSSRSTSIDPTWLLKNEENRWEDEECRNSLLKRRRNLVRLPNSAENFADQGDHYVFSMYIKSPRDISIYILTRYRLYNDGFIVKPPPRANTTKWEVAIRARVSRRYAFAFTREFLEFLDPLARRWKILDRLWQP